jgi:hypothetical protein
MNNIADDLNNAYSDGLRDGVPKWIKTTDRLPTEADAGEMAPNRDEGVES